MHLARIKHEIQETITLPQAATARLRIATRNVRWDGLTYKDVGPSASMQLSREGGRSGRRSVNFQNGLK